MSKRGARSIRKAKKKAPARASSAARKGSAQSRRTGSFPSNAGDLLLSIRKSMTPEQRQNAAKVARYLRSFV